MMKMNVATIESLRSLRAAVAAYETANTAVCSAQIAARTAGIDAGVDLAAIVQQELRSAAREFRSAYKSAADQLNEIDAEHLHAAVWA